MLSVGLYEWENNNCTPNTTNYVSEQLKNIWGWNPQNIWEHSASARELGVPVYKKRALKCVKEDQNYVIF